MDHATLKSQYVDGSLNVSKTATTAMIFIASGLLAIIVLFFATSETKFGEKKQSFADLGGNFTLTSYQGPVSLNDYQGKVVVMYFGFMTCPEVCPNSMGIVSNGLNRLSPTQLNNTQAILVSVDPKRDTPKDLAEYASYYHSNLVAVTGSKQEIDKVTRQYGAYYDFTEIENVTADYGVEHSSRYYIIDQTGKLITAMRHSTTANELHAQITQLLEREST